MIRFRPHSVGDLMTKPATMDLMLLNVEERIVYAKKTRTEEEKAQVLEFWERGLSQGAKSSLTDYAKEMLYGYNKVVTSKEMTKGIECETDTIALFNKVNFTRHVKNELQLKDEFLIGTPDIIAQDETLDAKTSWNVDTFPVLAADCHDPMYEWQGRAYMRLANKKRHTVFFGLVDTPDELLPRWEQRELHKVSHLNPALRITKITYERDAALEEKMIRKITLAQKYLAELITRINAEHNIAADWKKQFVV